MIEEQHQRPAAAKTSAFWSEKINTELFQHGRSRRAKHSRRQKGLKESRWDPYDKFARSEGR
ncbi:hypothetical protein RRF57_010327 [Xylaria bambusicola]|uniref:Uncharacterized protein n=1 Tax=Xylaria bambusicola TaxID=326684 RepID=A0AAN7UUT9_9PEZI